MKLVLIAIILLLPSMAFAQLNEQTCFCANPVDCEIGTIECNYEAKIDEKEFSGFLTTPFKSGDDPSPEAGASDLRAYNLQSRFNAGFFASSCTTKSFDLDFHINAYRFTHPNDFSRWVYILETQVLSFTGIDFRRTPQTMKLNLPGVGFSVEVTCLGRPN